MKSNGNLTLLRIAAQEGLWADVFSAGEISVVRMSVDSREELEHLASTAQALG